MDHSSDSNIRRLQRWEFKVEKQIHEQDFINFTSSLLVCSLWYVLSYVVIFSTYPPFFQGLAHTLLAWITFLVVLLMHIFCFVDKTIFDRSLWGIAYTLYHILLIVWFLLAMGFGYNWMAKQWFNFSWYLDFTLFYL